MKNLSTTIDLCNTFVTIGENNLSKMVDAGIIEKSDFLDVLFLYKQANKDSYSFNMNCVNDGNNTYEDTIYISVKDLSKIGHAHTMTSYKTMFDLMQEGQDKELKMILNSIQHVIGLRKKFKMSLHFLEVAEKAISQHLEKM